MVALFLLFWAQFFPLQHKAEGESLRGFGASEVWMWLWFWMFRYPPRILHLTFPTTPRPQEGKDAKPGSKVEAGDWALLLWPQIILLTHYIKWISLCFYSNSLGGELSWCAAVAQLGRWTGLLPLVRLRLSLKYRMNSSVRAFPTVYMNLCACWYILQYYWSKPSNTMKLFLLHVLTYSI